MNIFGSHVRAAAAAAAAAADSFGPCAGIGSRVQEPVRYKPRRPN